MIKLRDIIKEIMATNTPPPPVAHIQPASTNVFSSEFVNYMKMAENGAKKGFDTKTNMWYPHKSVEGGLPTIAYGHKIKNKHELKILKKGISDSTAQTLLHQDLEKAKKNVNSYIQRVYKVNLILTPKQEQMLIDFAFNLGGLDQFPKFTDAVLRDDVEKMKKEYKRYSDGEELGRNQLFFNTFLK